MAIIYSGIQVTYPLFLFKPDKVKMGQTASEIENTKQKNNFSKPCFE